MNDLWQYRSDIYSFETLPTARQDLIIGQIKTCTNDYQYGWFLEAVVLKLTDQAKILDLFNHYMANGHKDYKYSRANRIVTMCDVVRKFNEALARKTVLESKSSDVLKSILIYPNLTPDEEELGLRALSTSKYCPGFLYDQEYKPTLDTLKKLPSVMRLKCLETLTAKRMNSYNIFENITDSDEFKALLFSCTMKHRDRAEVVWQKYQELTQIGIPGTIKVKGTCPRCKDFEIVINSRVVRTKAGLNNTYLRDHINERRCPFCGCNLENGSFEEVA